MSKQKLPKLPKAGDTSNAAIGKRLEYVRKEAGYPVSRAKWFADAEPADWRKWEKGKTSIPPRNAWIVAQNTRGTVEWLLTGLWSDHPVPDELPVLGDDLSGFAARVKEARMRLGFSLADVAKVHCSATFIKDRWLRWEAGEDEPDVESASELAYALGVSVEWLFTDTEPGTAAKGKLRYQPDLYVSESNRIGGAELEAARKAAGLTVKDVAAILGPAATARELARAEKDDDTIDARFYGLPLALLLGVPLETLLYPADELANVRRRVERLRRRFGLPDPDRKADAA